MEQAEQGRDAQPLSAIKQVTVRVLPGGRMCTRNSAAYLGWSENTLAMRRVQGKRPHWLKVGGRVFYFKSELDAFIRGEGSSQKPTKLEAANPAKPSSPVHRPVAEDEDDDETEAAGVNTS